MLLLTEGRAGEVWESSNKECHVGYRGALDAEVLHTALCFIFQLVTCWYLPHLLFAFIIATFHSMPVTHVFVY